MAYFSNSSEGWFFDEQCAECIHVDETAMCPVAHVQMMYNYDQCADGQEKLRQVMTILVSDSTGCQVKPLIDKLRHGRKAIPDVLKKKLVFGDDEQIKALEDMTK
jgi:hypothetical protein